MRERRSSAASVPWTVRTLGVPLGSARPPGTHQWAWNRSAPASASSRAARRSARQRPASAPRPDGRPQRRLHGSAVGQRLGPGGGVADPAHRDAVELLLASPPLVARRDHAHRDAAARQGSGERREKSARDVAGPAGIVVGEEDHPHRSIPHVEFFEAGQRSGPLPGSPPACRRSSRRAARTRRARCR